MMHNFGTFIDSPYLVALVGEMIWSTEQQT